MRRIRIHLDQALATGARVTLPESASQHVVRVLRLGVGDELVLFNGDGSDYRARLCGLARRGAEAEVVSQEAPAAPESPLAVTLAQAMARGEKMDWVLQKATELGVAALVPLQTERTELRLDAERSGRRMQHWRGVVVAACEQCGRARIPRLEEPTALDAFAASVRTQEDEACARLVLDPDGDTALDALPQALRSAVVAVGPEGGWSARELDALGLAGFRRLRVGPRVLRTETAGLAMLALLQGRYGDLG